MRPRSSPRPSTRSTARTPATLAGQLLIPGFLALCILFGGSSGGGHLANTMLQLIAALILGYSVASFAGTPLSASAKLLIAIMLCWIAWACLQLVPLPPSIWTLAPGREALQQRLSAGGLALPWLPLSMSPSGTVSHLASLLPPLAVGAAILSRPAADSTGLRWIVPILALLSLLVGVGQLIGGGTSPLYFYASSNRGLPVGLMANANHQATLMLCAIPFVASLAGSERSGGSKGRGRELLFAAMTVMFLMGIAICQSYAAYILALPVTLASWAIARPRSLGPARYIGSAITLISVAALSLVALYVPTTVVDPMFAQNQLSRPAMYKVALNAAAHLFPLGSGPGAFVPTFKLFEDPTQVTNVFVNHSHSDYIELFVEGGVIGLVMIACMLIWWLKRATSIWFARSPSRIERAAVVATAAVLAHSLVDYPARTAAIGSILAAGLALMASRPVVKVEETSTSGRHLKAE